ncbi:MAG: hypothetical protein ABI612_22530 [Betaproteobacteria bacterium]
MTLWAAKMSGSRASSKDSRRLPDYGCLLQFVWQDVLRSAPSHHATLTESYQKNSILFNVRELEILLGVTRKGQLATALRLAGVRSVEAGPVDGFGELRQGGISFMPYEMYTIRGAVIAWYVMQSRGFSAVTAESLAQGLLATITVPAVSTAYKAGT